MNPTGPTDETDKVPVSTRTILRRVTRLLLQRGYRLHRTRGVARATRGGYYILEIASGHVTWPGDDLGAIARELGVLHVHEVLQDPPAVAPTSAPTV